MTNSDTIASFSRGAALSTSSTLGFSDLADLGPTAGNGFYRRWPDDLATLQELGVTDVRLTLDWARLQPKPGATDGDWVERFEQMITAAGAIDLRVWATLHDGSIPRWLDNEGGLADDEAITRWWPRWVEIAADRFGDSVAGWVPFVTLPADAPAQVWTDTWTILEGAAPVVVSIDPDRTAADALAGRADSIGLVLPTDWASDADITDEHLEGAATRWGNLVRDTAESADMSVTIAGFTPGHDDLETGAQITELLIATLDDAIGDGVVIDRCFVDPAIAGPDGPAGLLDADRSITPAGERFLA